MPDHSNIPAKTATVAPAAITALMPAKEQEMNELEITAFKKSDIQFKLAIGAPDDPLEYEADAVADMVMRMPEQNFIQRKCDQCAAEEEEELQRKPLDAFIQRKGTMPVETAPDNITSQVNAGKGSGAAMDNSTQTFMQNRFGADFSNVKIHTDSDAVQMNRDLNAKAFTVGSDIYFNSGQYNPSSGEGKHLLAHELTHTLQQSGGIERKIQRRPGDTEKKISYQLKVPEGVTTVAQWDAYLNKTIFGKDIHKTWTHTTDQIVPGEIWTVTIPAGEIELNTDPEEKEEHENKVEEFEHFTPAQKQKVNAEADKRFYEVSGDKEGTKIKTGEEGKANTWNKIRDEIIDEKTTLESLPAEIKELMGTETSFKPADYEHLLRIAEKLKQFSAEDLALYKLLAIRATDNLDLFEQSVDLFLARKKELAEAMKNNPPPTPPADDKEPASMEEAIENSWKDFDGSQLGTMSEQERESLARKRAWEVTKAQLEYMKDNPGKTALDFAKSATLMNTGETFKGIANDLKEAANGDANGYARWAAGMGAGAKISGWLLAAGAIVYALSWLTGIGELATIGAFLGYALGATIVLSAAEGDLRIKAAGQATNEKDFKEQSTKAGLAYSNVLISVAMLVVALGFRFLAKTFFPETLKNVQESLARFREKVRLKGGLKEILPEFESEMKGMREKLVESGEIAKKEAMAKGESIEQMSTEDFIKNLETGTDEFFSKAGTPEGEQVPWGELAKTPEGLKAIEQYKQTLAQELRNSVPKEIDNAVQEQLGAMDTMLDKARKSTTPSEFNDAVNEYEKFNTGDEVAKRGRAKEDQIRKEKTEEALKKIDEEIKKAEAEQKAAEEKRKAEELEKANQAAAASKNYGEIADYRKQEQLAPYDLDNGETGTVAKTEGISPPEYGENSSLTGKDFELRKKAFELLKAQYPKAKYWSQINFLTHAEAHALMKAWKNGTLQPEMTMYVDRPTCNMCMGGLGKLLKALGVEKLTVYSGGATVPEIIVAE